MGVAALQTVPHVHVNIIPKKADAPFPPSSAIPVTPSEERQELAAVLCDAWSV